MYSNAAIATDVAFFPSPSRQPRPPQRRNDRERRPVRTQVRRVVRAIEHWLEPTGTEETSAPPLRSYPY